MGRVVRKRVTRVLVIVLLVALLVPTVSAFAANSRYLQSGSFNASGSPMLNPNFTTDQWNKWEMVAWGVFLSNFVVPMADSYESAFSSSATYGSRGSGFKALNFSQAGDPGSKGILTSFLQFAVDNAMKETKELYVSYYYLDAVGDIIQPSDPSNINSAAIVMPKEKDPTKSNIQPESVAPANFTSLLPYNLADVHDKETLKSNNVSAWIAGTSFGSTSYDDVFGVSSLVYRPWKMLGLIDVYNYPDLIAIPPMADSSLNYKANNIFDTSSEMPKAYAAKDGDTHSVKDIAVAKLPILWLKANDGTYVKVWDMLDPWDYQVFLTMMAKELNSDATLDKGLGTEKVWETVMDNIDKAFSGKSPLKLDCFGNIVTLVDGKPLVVIPAAYNKHITTTPMVNLVNSLFLTGPTSGVSAQTLLDKGKMPVKSATWWLSNDNETSKDGASNFGPGLPAFGWKGASMPNNAVALYYDSDSLAYLTYKDRVKSGVADYYKSAIKYGNEWLFPQVAAILGVLDLSLDGNRQYVRNTVTYAETKKSDPVVRPDSKDVVVPRLALTGVSKATGLGSGDSSVFASRGDGVKSLMTALTFQEGIIGLLPASYTEVETEYVQKMIWQNTQSDILGSPVVIPVGMQSGSKDGKMLWSGLARDFVSYYGTTYYSANKAKELARLSERLCGSDGSKKQDGGADVFKDFTEYLMYESDDAPSLALISHAKTPNAAPYMNVAALAENSKLEFLGLDTWMNNTGYIWKVADFTNPATLDTGFWGGAGGTFAQAGFTSLTQRWVKAYPTNKVLTNVASYLGMRGDSEFAAAAAPYVYMTYLDIYGVGSADGSSGVNVSTLNKNPTKFNEKIYDAKSSPLFSFNPRNNFNAKSDADKTREINNYTYELLSPTGGHEYKRELLSTIVGSFIYDNYNKTVYGGSLEYRSGGVQQVVTRSQTGFLRFPSLEDNVFTRWFYDDYATVALVLLAVGMVFIIILGIFRGRKITWFVISTVLLVTSIVIIPFVNDIASTSMDGLVSGILKDKTTLWSMTEMIANSNVEADFLSSDLSAEEAEIAADITKSFSIAYTDRSLMLKQDISHKVVSLGNYAAYQQFASTRWMLPSILRQFTADDNSAAYLYVPLIDIADDAANAYWWYNPKDAKYSGGIAASDTLAKYAIGTKGGQERTEYTYETIRKFYPNYHWTDTTQVYDKDGQLLATPDPVIRTKLSYRSISQSVTSTETSKVVPIHDYIYMYMNNAYDKKLTPETATQQEPIIYVKERPTLTKDNATNKLFWGDPDKITDSFDTGGSGTYLSKLYKFELDPVLIELHNVFGHGLLSTPTGTTASVATLNAETANAELLQTAQKYVRDERDTMYGEFAYLWSTETTYPYFYALVKDTMDAMGRYDFKTGLVDNSTNKENIWYTSEKRLGLMLNALTGSPKIVNSSSGGFSSVTPDLNSFYGAIRSNFMFQSGVTGDDLFRYNPKALLPANAENNTNVLFTGYVRDVLDLESMFYNVIPYMYQMTVVTGGLVGEDENDKGLFGGSLIDVTQYKTYKGLPQSWLYRCNWATKIVEAPEYNKPERIGYYVGDEKKYAEITMTYFPEAYRAVEGGGRDMIFSEAQFKLSGLTENDLTTLELKLIKLNKEIVKKWTKLINYINCDGVTAEVLCRQMALEAMLSFNEIVTPKGLGNSAYALMPSTIDLRSLSFDTIMRVILINTSKNTNFFGTDAMESTITQFGMFSGVCLLVTTWICVYGVTIMRAFFLAFIFLMGVYGVARGIFASTASKKATLFGYLANIGILFVLSFLYYSIFNILMIGSDNTAYVNSGLKGASAAPTVAIIIILVASCVYIWLMWRMFRIALRSVLSGAFDLGYGTYKDKAQAGISRLSKSLNEMRMGHAFEDMGSSRMSYSRGDAGAYVAGVSGSSITTASSQGSSRRKRRGVAPSGTGSGSRTLSGNATRDVRANSVLDDHASVDSVIDRGGKAPSYSNPATNLDDYLSTPSPKKDDKPEKK